MSNTGRGVRKFFDGVAARIGVLLIVMSAVVGCQSSEVGSGRVEQSVASEVTAAEQVLIQSIAFHDPRSRWGQNSVDLYWRGRKPDGTVSMDLAMTLGPGGDFKLSGEYGGAQLEYEVENDLVQYTVDGRTEVSQEDLDRLVLSREAGLFWRNYFGFLGGMPMCLRDPDVLLEPEPFEVEFEGQTVQAIRGAFDDEVGTDIWTFYFDPSSYQLLGCRFDKADPTRDGETLVFEGLCDVSGVQLPKIRRWTMNADAKFLGTDELIARTE